MKETLSAAEMLSATKSVWAFEGLVESAVCVCVCVCVCMCVWVRGREIEFVCVCVCESEFINLMILPLLPIRPQWSIRPVSWLLRLTPLPLETVTAVGLGTNEIVRFSNPHTCQ